MTFRLKMFLVLSLLTALPAAPVGAAAPGRTLVQVLVGAGVYDAESLTFTSSTSGGTAREDLSTQPTVGLAGQYPINPGVLELGIEGSALFGWHSRRTTIVSNLNQTNIRIEASFWLADLSAGLYAGRSLGENWRAYAALGPTLLFADYSEDRTSSPDPLPAQDTVDNGSSEFGVGGYARLGLEYQLTPGGYVGVCLRGMASNLAFDGPASGSKVAGVQGFVTFSRWF